MRWLYVIQQRVSITSTECTALLTIGFLLVLGIVVQEVRRQPVSFSDEYYAASDQIFMRGERGLPDSALAVADTVEVVEENAPAEPESPQSVPPRSRDTRLIDLNSATAAQLQSLPRIGPKMAERIIEFREANGPFRSTRQLLQVRGIGEKTLDNLLPLLTVEASDPVTE